MLFGARPLVKMGAQPLQSQPRSFPQWSRTAILTIAGAEDSVEDTYIESEELERTWKSSRRQRLKQQEQRIWEEFVKEQDILSHVCKDDPYQFLDQLPESCLKELMEIELKKMRTESSVQQPDDIVLPTSEESDKEDMVGDEQGLQQSDSDDALEQDCRIFVFDDEESDQSDGESEGPASPAVASPSTVRERSAAERPLTPDKVSDKSPENVQSVIEKSVHCAKVKDLRAKINQEILDIVTTLDQRDISAIDPEELTKMCRHAAEFCTRFNRIYLYQLQRQIQDVKRNCDVSLPFARHTQLQSQMVRIVSLHQNLLQALQVFHKYAGGAAGACGAESAAAARALAGAARAATAAARRAHHAALYDDGVLISCEKLEEAISQHEIKMSDYMNSSVKNTNSSRSRRSSNSGLKNKTSVTTWSKAGSKIRSDAQSRLSMYSLDTLRSHVHPKASRSRDGQARGAKGHETSLQPSGPLPASNKVVKKSPRSRRPLMRGDTGGRPKTRQREGRVRTLVECTSSRVSFETTARLEPSPATTPRRCENTPRSGDKTSRHCDSASPNTQHEIRDEKSPRCGDAEKLEESLVDGVVQRVKMMYPTAALGRPSPRTRGKISPKAIAQSNVTVNNSGTTKGATKAALHSKDLEKPERSARDQGCVAVSSPERNRSKTPEPGRCEVTRIVKELCGGEVAGLRNERVSGAKNAQLYCVSGGSPRQPSTPQLLRILEESIQKKVPKLLVDDRKQAKCAEQLRLPMSVPEAAAERLRRRRAGFLQHMLTSAMYANSAIAKPWEAVERVSEELINGLLLQCTNEMQLDEVVRKLYNKETC